MDTRRALAAGLPRRNAEAFQGHHTAEFGNGRFRFEGDPGEGKSATGTYLVEGEVVRLVFETGVGLQLGRPYELGETSIVTRSPSPRSPAGSRS